MAEPRGIDALVALAAVDEALARLLLQDRTAAVEQSGVELTQTERRILAAIDDSALQAMIGRIAGGIADEDRRSFLGRSATAILTLLAGTSVLGAGGGGGGGRGGGFGGITPGRGELSGRVSSRFRIVMSKLTVTGALSREIVRRIMRRHINEVKYCFQKKQHQQPKLEGTLVLSYTMDPRGRVIRSKVSEGTLKNRKVELCVQRSAQRWLYPKPADGKPVEVSCEFGFYPVKKDPPAKKKRPAKKRPAKKRPAKKRPAKKKPAAKKKPSAKKSPSKKTPGR